MAKALGSRTPNPDMLTILTRKVQEFQVNREASKPAVSITMNADSLDSAREWVAAQWESALMNVI